MKVIEGNLLDLAEAGQFDVIVQGCNSFHCMGAGIAGQIAERYPEVVRLDEATKFGSFTKLGWWSSVNIERNGVNFEVINAYTQFHVGPNAEYTAVAQVFKCLNDFYRDLGFRFGIPQIGCGIGGLQWVRVEEIIDTVAPDLDITLVNYKP